MGRHWTTGRKAARRTRSVDRGLPSSARRILPPSADEDDGPLPHEAGEELALPEDGDDWPSPWGAARLGIP